LPDVFFSAYKGVGGGGPGGAVIGAALRFDTSDVSHGVSLGGRIGGHVNVDDVATRKLGQCFFPKRLTVCFY
jgi:hypothetical protein